MWIQRRTARVAGGMFLPFTLLALLSPHRAAAQQFHAASVQVLHGTAFHDAVTGNDTRDGRLSTVTLESVTGKTYGDNFFFVAHEGVEWHFHRGPASTAGVAQALFKASL